MNENENFVFGLVSLGSLEIHIVLLFDARVLRKGPLGMCNVNQYSVEVLWNEFSIVLFRK